VANAVNAQNLTLPSGTAKIGDSADHENPHLTLRWTRRNPPSQSL
jgi:hypothetical protein